MTIVRKAFIYLESGYYIARHGDNLRYFMFHIDPDPFTTIEEYDRWYHGKEIQAQVLDDHWPLQHLLLREMEDPQPLSEWVAWTHVTDQQEKDIEQMLAIGLHGIWPAIFKAWREIDSAYNASDYVATMGRTAVDVYMEWKNRDEPG